MDDFKKYSRQTALQEIGLEGQQKIQQAKVLCVGAGGLGVPVLQYLFMRPENNSVNISNKLNRNQHL